MAHFRAVIQGARGEASRLGTKRSHIYARLQTWGKDLAIQVKHNEPTGHDVATLWIMPHGSPSETPNEVVAYINLTTGEVFTPKARYIEPEYAQHSPEAR